MIINKHSFYYKYMVIVRQTKLSLKILNTNGDTVHSWEYFNGALTCFFWKYFAHWTNEASDKFSGSKKCVFTKRSSFRLIS